MHKDKHPLAGKTVTIKSGKFSGNHYHYRLEDWWDRVAGKSWMNMEGHPACIEYAVRRAVGNCPMDNEVVYGKIGLLGKLIHITEIDDEA